VTRFEAGDFWSHWVDWWSDRSACWIVDLATGSDDGQRFDDDQRLQHGGRLFSARARSDRPLDGPLRARFYDDETSLHDCPSDVSLWSHYAGSGRWNDRAVLQSHDARIVCFWHCDDNRWVGHVVQRLGND